MLARAVDPRVGFLVQQTVETVAVGDSLHEFHRKLVLIAGRIGIRVDRCHLMLGGRNLIVLGLGENADAPELLVEIRHKGGHTGF